MADIELVKPHSLTIEKAKALVQKAADALAAEYDLSSEWEGNTLHFHRSGVDGHMHVTHSEVRLHVTLGFLLKAFKKTFVDHIERNFDRVFDAQASQPQTKNSDKKNDGTGGEWKAKQGRRPRR